MNGGLPQIALERDGNNNLLRRYVSGVRRISMTSGSATSYYLYDGLGSVSNLTSSSGATQWTWSYEPFGAIRTETKAGGNQPTNFVKFTGEYLDPTGLYHLRARQYDPQLGRFLQTDPAPASEEAPYTGTYIYVANRPTVFMDPSGRTLLPSDASQTAITIPTTPVEVSREPAEAVGDPDVSYDVGKKKPDPRLMGLPPVPREHWGTPKLCKDLRCTPQETFIIRRESGFNPRAYNPTPVYGCPSLPNNYCGNAFGIGQLLDYSRKRYLGKDWNTWGPRLQLYAMRRYIHDRYGTGQKAYEFWVKNGWY